ncbi:MAG: hypothetical protein HY326_09345 [Chloroflexi bacterium]|nr:hypothetical protein [Chloroflexota bacterium]
MAEGQRNHPPSLLVRSDQPLIGFIAVEEGQEVVRYFVDEQDADAMKANLLHLLLSYERSV